MTVDPRDPSVWLVKLCHWTFLRRQALTIRHTIDARISLSRFNVELSVDKAGK